MQKTLNKGFTVNFQGNKQGVIETQDGNLFKLVDKEKKINTKPLMVFVYDIITMINAMMSLIMWDSVNKYLFDDSPFKNYVINNAIVFTTKIVVVLFGVIGVTFVFRKNESWIQLYSTVRLIETFMIGSLKFVYTIGLFRYSIENEEDPTQKNDFKKFTDTLAVVNLFDCFTFIILNIYFCNQLWIGINRKLSLESVKRKSLKLDNL